MASEKWIAGATAGWAAANTSSSLFNALGNGNALISDLAIDNSSNLDMFADLSWIAGGTATTASPLYMAFYVYPLLSDGSTYGDGRFGSAAAGPPPPAYFAGSFACPGGASTTVEGIVRGVIIPPGSFKFLVYNQTGVALANTNVFKYRTYNRQIA